MPVALSSLIEKKTDLRAHEGHEVHFPDEGAAILAKIERDHFWYTARRDAVIQLLSGAGVTPSGGTRPQGLDIGCGTGFNAVSLTELGYPTVGIDAGDAFSAYREAGLGAGFVRGDILSIDPEPEFEFVLLLDVLEHIEQDAVFLAQALKFVRPGGVVVVTVPAFPALWSQFDVMGRHHRRYTKRSLRETVARAGAEVSLEFAAYFYGATILPYAVSRLGQRGGFDSKKYETEISPHKLVNAAIKSLLSAERRFVLPLGGLPFGSSLFAVLRVTDSRRL